MVLLDGGCGLLDGDQRINALRAVVGRREATASCSSPLITTRSPIRTNPAVRSKSNT
jgi:hypothetical protein